MQALMLAAEEAERNPTPEMQLQLEADELEATGQWAAAEINRREILRLAESGGNPAIVAKAQLDLSHHLRWRGRIEDATGYAQAATESARRSDIDILVATMLDAQAWCALESGRARQALDLLNEAISLTDPVLAASMQARILAVRARCYALLGDETRAEEDLAACAQVLDRMVIGGFALGPIACKCRWLEATASLAERRRDFRGAVAAIEKALDWSQRLENVAAQMARARLLARLTEYCRQSGELQRAETATTELAALRSSLGLDGPGSCNRER
jgi:tetratricopeptide (TPR) repeat protein